MPTKLLPPEPDLGQLVDQAKDLLRGHAAGEIDVCQRIREFHPSFERAADPDIRSAPFTLADAELTIAREHGFSSWARLEAHVGNPDRARLDRPQHERIEDPDFRKAVDLIDRGDVGGLRDHLRVHPGLVRRRVLFEGGNYFREPTLLEFVAENPVRHDRLPPNIVDVARAILDAGAAADRRAIDETLGLVCSGRVPREHGVQVPLIDLLCDHGADPNGAMLAALGHGELDAVAALIRRGAAIDLVAAAAMGRREEARAALRVAGSLARHRALALAAQHGHGEIVGLLLDAGEDPDRYNPVGCHAHSTPLHQAALAGHLDVVRRIVERGGRLDIRDIHHRATPLGWAEYAGMSEVADYLRRAAAVR
jgi:hypothetical protein